MEELNNIWNADDELNEEQLMNYVQGRLSEADANAVEKKMADSSFVNDAVEGLQQFSSPEKINALAQQINEDLHRKLSDKKLRRKRGIQGLSWEIIAVIMIILLCLLGYTIITMMRK